MKKLHFKILSLLIMIALSACNKQNISESISDSDLSSSLTQQESESSIEEITAIENENYKWPFKEGNSYSGNMFFSACGYENSSNNLKLKIDDEIVEKENIVNYDGTIIYDIDPAHPVHSDTVEHCFNEITFNGVSLGALPSDNSHGIKINNDDLYEGENIFTITIGETYGHKSWNKNLFRGGFRHGWGDDFKIANVYLKMVTGEIIKPTKMIIYKPADLSTAKYNTYEIQQVDDEFYWLGDGWGSVEQGHLSVDGSQYENSNVPFQIDYYFDYDTPLSLSTFNVDTNKYEDGNHIVSLYNDDKLVLLNNVCFDNTSPEIKTNIKDNQYVNNHFIVKNEILDKTSHIASESILLDGNKMNEKTFSLSFLSPGKHNMIILAKDNANNQIIKVYNFIILADAYTLPLSYENQSIHLNSSYDSNM
ncbi:MAG: hypothetical protein MR270_05310, partial [Erysipelotrichaceae bacterium]|nr:hypothetical protein [Erysipelotrichaceae bacterium]